MKNFILKLYSAIVSLLVGRNVYGFIIKTKHGDFAIDARDSVIGLKLRFGVFHEENDLDIIKSLVNKNSFVLFVGAHIGTLAIPTAKQTNKVVAIEANPETYEFLKFNIYLNNVSNIRLHNIAAADKIKEIKFLLSKINTGGSKIIPKTKRSKYYYDNPQVTVIKAYPLDIYFKMHNFDLIVMDIEGSEYFALKGMKKILQNSKHLMIEFIPDHIKDVANVTFKEFWNLLAPYFKSVTFAGAKKRVSIQQAKDILERDFNNSKSHEAIIFSKDSL